MAQSPDHLDLPFLRAQKTETDANGVPLPMYSINRRGKSPRWIVIHDMEYPENPTAAEWTANYFHTGAGGRSVSSHYCADADSIVQCVLLKDAAWTVGNSQGNDEGINWELAGYASQTREQWLDAYSSAMLQRIAPYIVSDAARFGIPLRTLTDAQVAAREPGITSHWQMGRVFGGTDHTDPGPNFPWDYLMALLTGAPTQGGDDMPWWVRTKSGKAHIATGAMAPSGKIAAWFLSQDPATPPNMSSAHNALLGSVIVDLPNDDGGGVYDLNPQPWPVGGNTPVAVPEFTVTLSGTAKPAAGK